MGAWQSNETALAEKIVRLRIVASKLERDYAAATGAYERDRDLVRAALETNDTESAAIHADSAAARREEQLDLLKLLTDVRAVIPAMSRCANGVALADALVDVERVLRGITTTSRVTLLPGKMQDLRGAVTKLNVAVTSVHDTAGEERRAHAAEAIMQSFGSVPANDPLHVDDGDDLNGRLKSLG